MVNVLIAEGFSCQREVILLLRKANFFNRLRITASHSQHRPEIFDVADSSFILDYSKFKNSQDYVQQILDYCVESETKIVFAGKYTKQYEKMRSAFEEKGIELFTGAIGVENQQIIKDKMAFTVECQKLGLPVTPAVEFNSVEELQEKIAELKPIYGQLSVKPAEGVYGYGFLELNDDISLYDQLNKQYVCRTEQFVQAYAELEVKPKYLLMPFLSGKECSVDIACNHGEILSKATRTKQGDHQEIQLKHEVDAVCAQLVKRFNCHGLINIQFRKDTNGVWHILEINARPAGGFAYSAAANLNLVAHLFKSVFSEILVPCPVTNHFQVKSISSVVRVTLPKSEA